MAIGVPSTDVTVEIEVCAAPAVAMVPMHNNNTVIVRIDAPSVSDDCVPVYHAPDREWMTHKPEIERSQTD